MTQIELDNLKRELRGIREAGSKTADEIKMLHEKIFCIEMINSIIAYSPLYCNGAKRVTGEQFVQREEEKRYNYLADYIKVLGRETVVKLAEAQLADIACVKSNVFVDDEGLSYNSIVWQH